MALLPDSSWGHGKKAKGRVRARVCVHSRSIYKRGWSLNDSTMSATLKHISHISNTQTHIVLTTDLKNTRAQKTGMCTTGVEQTKQKREENTQEMRRDKIQRVCVKVKEEDHQYHLKCDLKQLIRYDVSAILQTL